jgi:bifunctional N-acetylglucosamine-1-phosphate-uridyltransferase/glucosamine-1-phosphate-acetyltransferase GlmU-like protein
MSDKKFCAVIPAAGRGSRLGLNIPKILVPLQGEETIWQILLKKLYTNVDHIHVVLSREGYSLFQNELEKDELDDYVSLSIQDEPRGMGDAIFCGYKNWAEFENILIIWGDQVYVSEQTINKTLELQSKADSSQCTIPVTVVEKPYVQYLFDDNEKLLKILQEREGDICQPKGFADVGTFCLSVDNLLEAWSQFLKLDTKGSLTGEINFLPFLSFLSTQCNWAIKRLLIQNSIESRGINTKEDLDFFRNLYMASQTKK